ncbi:GntR family transcriptional regulator / MocR family aminotransferase [Pararobbsia alpina]|uniref:MocR-like pyridoxine biosynthesis transcription factor PdxR n=1 Tax=Pararobbsia alpina TaxID=621374 RepID=UPI0039A6284B
MTSSVLSDWLAQRLVREGDVPLYRQLHQLLQQAILSHMLAAGAKLPSSRLLADELAIARNTVTNVYEQLSLEGYVQTTRGSGTYVTDNAPEEIDVHAEWAALPDAESRSGALSARGQRLVAGAGASNRQWGAFVPGVPDVTAFPTRVWSRLHNKYWRRPHPELMTYSTGGGYLPLRQALADYLRTARSVRCAPEQVIVTTGIHQSVDLAVRLLSDAGDVCWTEDPCYWGVRTVLQSSGLHLRSIPVDAEGLNPSAADLADPPKLMLVTPSHQYPLGIVMSLARRRMLLEYARRTQCWIIEDDYDSEFRYGNRPLASLQGLDTAGQVIYVGSLGKILYPGLRVGYLVVPEALVDHFQIGLAELYREGNLVQQAVLADFIAEGHFTSHIRRMRNAYGARRQLMMDAIAKRFGDPLPVLGDQAGLHLVASLPEQTDDRQVVRDAMAAGIATRSLSTYFSDPSRAPRGLLLGYACVPDDAIEPNFDTLASVIEKYLHQEHMTRHDGLK